MKKFLKNETARLNTLLAVLIIIAVAVTVLVNLLASTLSDRYPLSLDLTSNAAYDLGPDTMEILENLTEDVNISVLSAKGSFTGNPYLVQMKTLLEKYARCSSHISLEFIDYTTDPAFASQYPELELSAGDVLVRGPAAVKQIRLANMFTYTADTEGNVTVSGSRVEEALTSALVSAVTSDPVGVGILTGNAVSYDREALLSMLQNNNYEVREADMVTGNLNDFDVLILLSPGQDLSEDVLSKFDEFLYNSGQYGKTLIYAAGAEQTQMPNLNVFLREWGISVDDGAVFETSENNAYGYQPYYPFADYSDETFRDLIRDSSKRMLMPVSKPLSLVFEYKDNKTVTTLLAFSETAGVRPSGAGSNFTTDQAVKWGPMPALVMSTLAVGADKGYSNVIVSASAQAFSQSVLANTSVANAEYITSMLNRITDRGDAVALQPKSLGGNALTMTTGTARIWSILLCIVIPAAVLIAGIAVYLKRRYQ